MHILESLPNLGVTKVNKRDKHNKYYFLGVNVWKHQKFFIMFEPCKNKAYLSCSKYCSSYRFKLGDEKDINFLKLKKERYDILLRASLITLYNEEKIGHIKLSEKLKNSRDYKEALEWYTHYKNKLKLNRYI